MNTSWIRQQHLEYDCFFTKYIFVKKLSFNKYISVEKKTAFLRYRFLTQHIFNNYSPKAKLMLLNNPRDEVEGIIQQY